MAQNDEAVQIAARGYVFTGTAEMTRPSQAAINTYVSAGTVPAGLTEAGHTDAEDVLAFGQDEGDTEVMRSWQKTALREVTTSAAVDYFVINHLEITNEVLSFYYGGGDVSAEGVFGVPTSAAAQQRAVLIIMVDGDNTTALWVPKASIRREDAPEFATDDFTKFPIRYTVLSPASGSALYWVHPDLGDDGA